MGRANRWRIKRLPEKLLQIRTSLDLSQSELVRELKLENVIYRSNISSFETGDREPPSPVLLAYAQLVGISTDLLINDNLDLPTVRGR